MQTKTTFAHVAAALLLAGMLGGCGKAAPVQQAPVIDSVFTRTPDASAPKIIAKRQQDQQDAAVASNETTRVAGRNDDGKQ